MKQKDAVKMVEDSLPLTSYHWRRLYLRPSNLHQLWWNVLWTRSSMFYLPMGAKAYHYSSAYCYRPEFMAKECLCFVVDRRGGIIYHDKHLPYQGTSPGCLKKQRG